MVESKPRISAERWFARWYTTSYGDTVSCQACMRESTLIFFARPIKNQSCLTMSVVSLRVLCISKGESHVEVILLCVGAYGGSDTNFALGGRGPRQHPEISCPFSISPLADVLHVSGRWPLESMSNAGKR